MMLHRRVSKRVALALMLIALSTLPGCARLQEPGSVSPDEDQGTVCGGSGNSASAVHATVCGGTQNSAAVEYAVVSGGVQNVASATRTTIGGGYKNSASQLDATVGGGGRNTAGGIHATVAGGSHNTASGYDATVGGGSFNAATGTRATVAGGSENTASNFDATVSGGAGNTAAGVHAAVGGGLGNMASDIYATVAGGYGNTGSGSYATIPGGSQNRAAGDYSFAAGRRATVDAAHPGTFLFADANDFAFPSEAANEFAVRATGGVRLVSAVDGNGQPTAGVELPPGSGSWSVLSAREAKANLAPVDGAQIAEALAGLPIFTWSYRSQSGSIRHIGPMAQDFYAAFDVGEDDQHISAVDADGVALAALQGVYQLLQERDAQVATQQVRIEALEARVVSLEAALAADEHPTRSLFRDTAAGWLVVGNLFLFGAVVLHRTRRHGPHRSE
jgi:hypothetical protein